MKRVYKIIVLFVVIFLLGVMAFAGYINYSIDKKEAVRAAHFEKSSRIRQVKYLY